MKLLLVLVGLVLGGCMQPSEPVIPQGHEEATGRAIVMVARGWEVWPDGLTPMYGAGFSVTLSKVIEGEKEPQEWPMDGIAWHILNPCVRHKEYEATVSATINGMAPWKEYEVRMAVREKP